jgi:hypothetical protein
MAPRTNIKDLEDLGEKVKVLRESDPKTPWSEISETMEVSQGKLMLAYNYASVRPKDRVKAKTEDELASAIVDLRDDESLSWGIISARTAMPESKCRSLYEKVTGTSTKGNRIGKGGRHPDANGAAPTTKPAKTQKKAPANKPSGAAKAASAKKKAKKTAAKADTQEGG